MQPRVCSVAAVAAAVSLSVPAQQLVRDIVQTGAPGSSSPRDFVVLPGLACFVASTRDAGYEPWVTDGTAAGTFRLRDLTPGPALSSPDLICEYQGRVLLAANQGQPQRLYLTDGTTAGTVPVPDLGVAPVSLARLANGALLLNAANATYSTDLTAAGTQPIPGMRRFEERIAVGGVSYGSCQNASGGYELWATDGTAAGSSLVATLPVGAGRPVAFTTWNGRIYFVEVASFFSAWIASTDGVAGYTRHAQLAASIGLPPTRMFVRNNVLVLQRDGLLTTSDLTPAGTGALPVSCADCSDPVELGGQLFFRASTPANGFELWCTDGTAAGTAMVADLMPGVAGSHPEHLLPTAAGLLFRALLPSGRRLLRLSGTSTITDLGAIPDDAPSGVSVTSPVSGFVPFQNGVLFGGTDAAGTELWRYDGAQPPYRLRDIDATGPGLLHGGTGPRVPVRDRMFFTAYDGVSGVELWSSDGTAAGTRLLDLVPGTMSEFDASAGSLARYGDRVAFASRQRVGLTDGTAAGTVTLTGAPQPGFYGPCKVFGEELWFVRSSQLYHSDGTVAGTALAPFPFVYNVQDVEVLSDRLVVQSISSLWGTDGLTFPQHLATFGQQPVLHRIAPDRLVLTSSTGIVVTDGTPAGTSLLAPLSGTYGRTATGPGVAYVLATGNPPTPGVWQSDGTAAGTFLAAPLPVGMDVYALVATAHELFAVAATPANGRELWRLDRVAGQLVPALELAPGAFSGVYSAAALGVGDLLLVAGGDEATGIEPHVTDGTAAGTFLLADVHPGSGNSNPHLVGIADDLVFFTADDGVHGLELWSAPVAQTGAAVLQGIGRGCPGSRGFPRLSATDLPRPGAFGFGFELAHLRSLALAALGLADDHAPSTILGCELLLGGGIATRLGFADITGTASFALPLPNSPQLVGLRLVAQGFALDALAPAGFTSSDGLIFVCGR